jgi:hypothetical protein
VDLFLDFGASGEVGVLRPRQYNYSVRRLFAESLVDRPFLAVSCLVIFPPLDPNPWLPLVAHVPSPCFLFFAALLRKLCASQPRLQPFLC